MIRKEITFDGIDKKITEEYYFALTTAELMEQMLEVVGDVRGDLESQLRRVIDSNDPKLILSTFKDIVLSAVGLRSGDKFMKTKQTREEFEGSGAYSELLFEMITNAGFAAQFIKGMLPQDFEEKVKQINAAGVVELPTDEEDTRPAWLREGRNPTEQELAKMSTEEMKLAFRHRMAQPQAS
jgi:hypothetical protein